jgi:hypothetical protein
LEGKIANNLNYFKNLKKSTSFVKYKSNNKKMKFKRIFLVTLAAVVMFSCKNEPKTEVIDNKFKVTLNLLIQKNDTIHLYYTEDNSINFKEESSIWLSLPGKNETQDITFELPEDVFPTQFRFDLGVNPENEKIKLNGVKFNYREKSFAVNDSAIYRYFRVNTDNSNLDPKSLELSRKDSKIAAGPCLYPLEVQLKTEIDKLAK